MELKRITTWLVSLLSFVVFFCLLIDGAKTEARTSSEKIEDILFSIHENSLKPVYLELEEKERKNPSEQSKEKEIIISYNKPLPEGAPTCYKHVAGEDQNQYVRIAAQISANDISFLALLDAENGLWTPDRKHGINSNGSSDWGFCGTNDKWNSKIVNDERFFTDPRWQLEQCYRLYKGGTIFYGKSRTHITRKNFICP